MEEIEFYLEEAADSMKKAVDHFASEVSKIRAGKASVNMFDGVSVEYYGSQTPINQVSSVNAQDAKTIVIKPWEKNMLEPIERAILGANLGVTPMNDGDFIRIVMPPLTEERRVDLVKKAREIAENSRITIRNIRRDANDALKKLKNDGASEDMIKDGESSVQDHTNKFIAELDKYLSAKEEEIMKV
jgi:ribosome recycling factor